MSTKSKADIKSEQTQQKHQQQQEQNGSAIDVLNITNTLLAILIVYALYKLFGKKKRNDDGERFRLPDPLPKHDMTLDELRRYDGTGPDKRICLAILGRVYDCTKGHEYYGPGGAYSPLAGRDASRALALFDLSAVKDEWDDITDLDSNQLSSVMEWNEQFQERYDYIGRLVRSKEEILERADFEEDIDIGGEKQKKSSMKNDKQQHSSTTDDDEIEVINSSEQESTNGNMGNTSKKVSFLDAKHKKNDSGDDGKKLSESSDDIEVIETAAKNDTDN